MTLLTRYLMRQNFFLLIVLLLIGVGIYLLTDLFERMDDFLGGPASLEIVLLYFAVKLPMIISQILPAVFILGLVFQFNILERSRELIALATGGVSPVCILRFVCVYSLLWSLLLFAFGQVLGVKGEKAAQQLWQEDILGKDLGNVSLEGLWFTEENLIVHVDVAYPAQGKGTGVLAYQLDESRIGIDAIIKAESFSVDANGWQLRDGARLVPSQYLMESFSTMELPVTQDLQSFQIGEKFGAKPSHLTLDELGATISRLERAGSNVEILRTAWHNKIAYSASMLVMGFLGVLVSRMTGNIYKAGVLALLIVFLYYSLNVFCTSLGEAGAVPPVIGAWFANAFFLIGSIVMLSLPALRDRVRR